MKKSLSLLLAVMLVISLLVSACSSKTGSEPEAITPETGETADAPEGQETQENTPVTLRFCWWGSQTRNDQTLEVINLLKGKYPWLTVECEYVGWGVYWDNLATQVASNDIPDLIQHDYRYLETYVNRGLLSELDPYIGEPIDLDNVSDMTLSGGKINGSLYGIPMGMNTFSVIYNESIFEEAGIPAPEFDWTYDNFKDISRQFKDKIGIYGCDLTNFEDYVLFYIRSQGGSLYAKDGKGLGYTDDSILKECFSRRLELVKEGLLPTPDVAKQASGTEDSLIVRGQAAMVTYWSNATAAVANAMPDSSIKVAPVFGPDSDLGTYIKPSMFLSISASSENKEECAMIIDYFTNDVEANHVMMGERGVPISSAIRATLEPELPDYSKAIFNLLDYAGSHSSPIDPPDPENSGQIVELLQDLEEQVLYDKITPEEAAASFRQQAESILGS